MNNGVEMQQIRVLCGIDDGNEIEQMLKMRNFTPRRKT